MMNFSDENITTCYNRQSNDWKAAVFFYSQSVVCTLLIIFGLFGNTLSFFVLRRERPKTTTALTLQALAVTDSAYLVCHFFFLSMMGVVAYKQAAMHYSDAYAYLMLFIKPLMFTCQQCSIWFVVLVTVDRYIVVCWPLKAGAYCTKKRARNHIILVTILSLIYNIPRWFELGVSFCYDETLGHLKPSNFDREWTGVGVYKYFYAMAMNSLVNFVAPMAVLVFVNTSLIIALRKAGKEHHQLTGKAHPSRSTTVMLVVVVLVFVACQTCDFILQFLYFLDNKWLKRSPSLFVYYMISSLMVVVNASTNFLIYCICGRKFRKLLQDMIRKLCGRREGSGSRSSGYTPTPVNQTLSNSLQLSHHSTQSSRV